VKTATSNLPSRARPASKPPPGDLLRQRLTMLVLLTTAVGFISARGVRLICYAVSRRFRHGYGRRRSSRAQPAVGAPVDALMQRTKERPLPVACSARRAPRRRSAHRRRRGLSCGDL
jgi:hypothetical protein